MTDKLDLANERLGGVVLAANDDFFAEKENLVKASDPIFIADKYTDNGKWMDGWETRRRREEGYDWAIVRLGAMGRLSEIVVDTSHFRGNYPEHCSIEGCALAQDAGVDEVLAHTNWTELVGRKPLQAHHQHKFAVSSSTAVNHLRLNIFPDGGVARLRVFGTVLPDWPRLIARGEPIDLAAACNGGFALSCSDMFFSDRNNLLRPHPPINMGDGWETQRRRGPGHDWVILRLGRRGSIERAEVHTTHFKGNAPDRCCIDVCDTDERIIDQAKWTVVLEDAKLEPHTLHTFEKELLSKTPATHVRFRIYPDGGVARLRLYGTPDAE